MTPLRTDSHKLFIVATCGLPARVLTTRSIRENTRTKVCGQYRIAWRIIFLFFPVRQMFITFVFDLIIPSHWPKNNCDEEWPLYSITNVSFYVFLAYHLQLCALLPIHFADTLCIGYARQTRRSYRSDYCETEQSSRRNFPNPTSLWYLINQMLTQLKAAFPRIAIWIFGLSHLKQAGYKLK